MQTNVLFINGANLNLLGKREPHIYGSQSLDDINLHLQEQANKLNLVCHFFQSNSEGEIINRIHQAMGNTDYIVINPGAFTHTSVALRDALLGVNIPFIEVHLSNIHAREAFRHHSYLSDKAVAVLCGLGAYGYEAALSFIANKR
ncbi:3-dehydroquinate dehydratase [Pelistega indica]|uniref:3-dehydroquinate dehydratase n=1 Tax=Pelistega indica TaxID=1414851 RepID=V8G6X2_9BURK|nr:MULTISPECIES: type II 3-dehydroquinate dehydratase [Pelistega]ETD72155.1 3-dehydroquinate dehydratase [Pelistega indica]